MKSMKKCLVDIWNMSIDILISIMNKLSIFKDSFIKMFTKPPQVESLDATIEKIIQNKCSVCRYGDGEFKLIRGRNIAFQNYSKELSEKLSEILMDDDENLLVCLPDILEDLNQYAKEPKEYWRLYISKNRKWLYKQLNKEKVYYNSFISRCYYMFNDKSKSEFWFEKLKLIWEKRDIVIIEGKKSRLGIGNDLFDGTNSIERILVPEENAYSQYREILAQAEKIDKNKLVLLAVGPTATALAYDLHKNGYQVIDIGHVDIEYEWFLRKATSKIKIENKYVCEAGAGIGVTDIDDEKYKNEVIVEIVQLKGNGNEQADKYCSTNL